MFKFIDKARYPKPKRNECHLVLLKFEGYYQNLNPKMRQVFVKRTLSFLRQIKFSASDQIRLTFEIKVMVASGFIQLTFGLKRYRLNFFKHIHIAHQPYVYKEVGVPFHGDTNPKTARINLVWSVVKEGFLIPDDALNLCLHEFSHALTIENQKRIYFNRFYPQRDLLRYFKAAEHEMQVIKNGKDSIFRNYGAANVMEFFAVSVEVFFEQPRRFAIENPILFEKLCFFTSSRSKKIRKSATLNLYCYRLLNFP